jgi:hypothetical protein
VILRRKDAISSADHLVGRIGVYAERIVVVLASSLSSHSTSLGYAICGVVVNAGGSLA